MHQDEGGETSGFRFPRWTTTVRPGLLVLLLGGPLYIVLLLIYGFSPVTRDVGYQPRQPVPYSHALHAGELGIDCRYCHSTVESGARAAVPATEVCMNCHAAIRTKSEKLTPIRESFATGMPVHWVRVHDLPDFVYFNHGAHIRRGVGCVECHDRVDKMEVVYQAKPLSMAWCLDCHRNPDAHLRPPELVTRMDWVPEEEPAVMGSRVREELNLHPSTDCWVCHR